MRLTASIAAAALLAAGCATDTTQPSGAITYNGVKDCAAFNVAGLGLADAKTTWVPGKDALPSYCEVSGTLHPVAGSDIGVVYRLPEGWNGKVYGVGGGGWIGNTALQTVSDALRRGYATMSTDGGHPIGNVWDNSWAVMPEKANDFSYRAIHEMTAAGKKVAAAYYGKKHSRAYLRRLLHRRAHGPDGSAAFPRRLRRHRRRRPGLYAAGADQLGAAHQRLHPERAASAPATSSWPRTPRWRSATPMTGSRTG